MKAAVPVWQGRVSPVFDVARRLLVVEIVDGVEAGRFEHDLQMESPPARAKRLAELGVDVLICGAISRPLEAILAAEGVHVVAQTCGDVDEVMEALASGRLNAPAFLMPGCLGGGRRFRGWRGRRGRRPFRAPGGAV